MPSPRLRSAVPVLAAVDLPGCVAFWNALGFSGGAVGDDFATLRRDDVELFVARVGADAQVVPDNTQAWVRVAGVDALHAEWKTKVPPASPDVRTAALTAPTDFPWGREVVVRDVAGNCVHFNERAAP
jgi:hypothetical protein